MDRRQRIATIALGHTGCSVALKRPTYADVIVRPQDPASAASYYFDNPSLSTCSLFALGCLRLAGCAEPECVSPYYPRRVGQAMIDIQVLARRFGAWVTSSPPVPQLRAGDIWIITDEHGGDAHAGVCTSDALLRGDTMITSSAEGGQFDGRGSTAIGAFTRTWRLSGNRWMLGARYLLGFANAGRMPVPDTIDAPAAPAA